MQSSLPSEPAVQNIKAVDAAEFVEIAMIVEVCSYGPRTVDGRSERRFAGAI
jgi:hypothetical protein